MLHTMMNSTLAWQRIEELEDIIRRKNTIVTKLKKDIVVLEQKVRFPVETSLIAPEF